MRAYRTVSCSVTGYRKKTAGLPCEDATKVLRTKEGTVMAVGDGHGDKRCLFASVGSRLATEAACHTLRSYLKAATGDPARYWNDRRTEIAATIAQTFALYVLDDYVLRCKGRLSAAEVGELEQHIRGYFSQPSEALTPAEIRERYLRKKQADDRLAEILYLYGTTVRASVLTDRYLFNCALGDGDTVAVIGDRVEWLLPSSEAFSCETASLCEPFETVADSFLFSFVTCGSTDGSEESRLWDTSVSVPTVMLATDGLRNSFFSDALFAKKILDISKAAHLGKREAKTAGLKRLFERLTMESVYQDDISAVIAVTAGENEKQ